MYIFFSVLIVITAVLLVLIVLVQNSKGGGLASNFSQGNQVMGVRKTADFLEKATWGLAIALVAFCLLASFSIPKPTEVASPREFDMPAQQQQQQQPPAGEIPPIED